MIDIFKNGCKLAKIMKEGDSTEKLVESLVKELNCETVFTIPVFGGIAVDEGVVVTWIIMAVLTILSIVFVRNLSIEKTGKGTAYAGISDRLGTGFL